MPQGPVKACNADVVESGRAMPEKFQGDVGLLRDRVVGGSCGTDSDTERGLGKVDSLGGQEGEGSGWGMIFSLGEKSAKLPGFCRVDPCGQDGLPD